MKALILAGGSGTRLWPHSRTDFPKQFLTFSGEESFLQKTIRRKLKHISADNIFILTSDQYQNIVKKQAKEIDSRLVDNILLEPHSRNTAPAIALAIKYAMEKRGFCEEDIFLVSPADHLIDPEEKFIEYLKESENLAKEGHIVTFGIVPTHPETGYGYIKGKGHVEKFVEKPDFKHAQEYVASGDYYWNAGLFVFTIETFLKEMEEHASDIYKLMSDGYEQAAKNFSAMPNISIDYAIMEKSKKSFVLPMHLNWSDVGSWDNVYQLLPKDEAENATIGNVVAVDTKNSLVIADKRLVATIGVEDLLIIETADVLLISKRDESQKVKQVVEQLKKEKRVEINHHVTTCRPWGSYTVLDEGERYKVKKITVDPLQTLSLQKHFHRSEHWTVVSGCALVTIDGKESYIHENESIYVPKGAMHRVSNPGKVPLEIIEAQVGEYVGEDDIIRFDDIYGRIDNGHKN